MSRIFAFTLLELLITVCIVVGVSLFAIPAGYDFVAKARARTIVNGLVTTMNYARHEAIRFGQPVIWCGSKDGQHCRGDWAGQQIIFVDSDGNHQVNRIEQLLRVREPIAGKGSLTWRGFRSADYIEIRPYGMGMAMSGRFLYCPANQDKQYARTLTSNRLGRMRLLSTGACG